VVKFLSQQEETIQLRIVLMSKFRVLENTMELTDRQPPSFGEGNLKVAIRVGLVGSVLILGPDVLLGVFQGCRCKLSDKHIVEKSHGGVG
jgi:hypothetical protein